MPQLPIQTPPSGPLLDYIKQAIGVQDRDLTEQVKETCAAIRRVLDTEDGRKLLDLLEKSTTQHFLSPLADERALEVLNAQRFIALDLRRIMSNETDQLLSIKTDAKPSGRGRPGRRRGQQPDA